MDVNMESFFEMVCGEQAQLAANLPTLPNLFVHS